MTDREQYRVTLSIPVDRSRVERPQDAINIAVSETGKRIARATATHIDQSDQLDSQRHRSASLHLLDLL